MPDDTKSEDADPNDEDRPDLDEDGPDLATTAEDVQEGIAKGRKRLEEGADKAVEQFDEGIIDLLSWALDTETRARIYVYLRGNPGSTSEEIAEGTGLYPSTVREALAELTEEEKVTRQKRESEGAGNNPYEYEAIAPSELVSGMVQDVQEELNTVFNLDRYLGEGEVDIEPETEPISITVEDESALGGDDDESDDGSGDAAVDEDEAEEAGDEGDNENAAEAE